MRPLALVLCIALIGCARSAIDRGLGWRRVVTDHVRLMTDAEPEEAIETARTLESYARALDRAASWCPVERTVPMDVVVVSHEEDFDTFRPADRVPYFVPPRRRTWVSPPRVVLRASHGALDGVAMQAVLHASMHRRVAMCAPRVPLWLAEGLAEKYETLRIVGGALVVGIPPYRFEGGTYRLPSDAAGLGVAHHVWLARLQPGLVFGRPPESGTSESCAFHPEWRGDDFLGPTVWALVHHVEDGGAARDRFHETVTSLDAHAHFEGALLDPHTGLASLQEYVLHAPPFTREPFVAGEISLAEEDVPPDEADLLWASLLAPSGGEAELALARECIEHARWFARRPAEVELAANALGIGTRTLEELAREYPHDLDVLRASAVALGKTGRTSNEARYLLLVMTDRSDLSTADHVELAALASHFGQHALSRDLARAAVDESPELPWSHAAFACAAWADGDFATAREELHVARLEAPPPDANVPDEPLRFELLAPSPTSPPPSSLDGRTTPAALDARHSGEATPTLSARAFEEQCVGLVDPQPALVVSVPDGGGTFAVSSTTAVLVVRAHDGTITCTRDLREGSATLARRWPPGPLEVFVGRPLGGRAPITCGRWGGDGFDQQTDWAPVFQYDVAITAPDLHDAVTVGARVVPHHHTDRGRGENWAPPMDAYLGQTALVTADAGLDEAGEAGVRIDLDGGTWFWRVADLELAQ
jgi:hypothetical protein